MSDAMCMMKRVKCNIDCLTPYFYTYQHKQFTTCALCNLSTLQPVHFATHALCNMHTLQHLDLARYDVHDEICIETLYKSAGWINETDQLNGSARLSSWTDQLDGPVLDI